MEGNIVQIVMGLIVLLIGLKIIKKIVSLGITAIVIAIYLVANGVITI